MAVLSSHQEREVLKRILSGSNWNVNVLSTLQEAQQTLVQDGAGCVITEADLPYDGSWKDIMRLTQRMAVPPPVIVVSSLYDERLLWAEVLNLGGFDVLLKPFDSEEVLRTLNMASRNWQDRLLGATRPRACRVHSSLADA